MQCDKLSTRMAGKNPIASFQQLRVAGKVLPMKRPVWMIVQFLETFVEPVNGQEERLRVGDVNGHRHTKCAARLPHGIKSRIVHFNETARPDVFSEIQPQYFFYFHSISTGA